MSLFFFFLFLFLLMRWMQPPKARLKDDFIFKVVGYKRDQVNYQM